MDCAALGGIFFGKPQSNRSGILAAAAIARTLYLRKVAGCDEGSFQSCSPVRSVRSQSRRIGSTERETPQGSRNTDGRRDSAASASHRDERTDSGPVTGQNSVRL